MKTKTKIVLTIPLAVASLLMLGHAAEDIPGAAASLERVATDLRMAEGPVWDGESLIFSDVPSSKILKLGSDGKVSTIRSDTRWGAGLGFDSARRLIICEVMGRRVTRVEKDGTEKTLAESYEGKKLNGPNDLTVDTKDGIYFTDPLFLNKDKREQDKEAVYYISPKGKVLRVADDLERPNGIALARDGKTLFVADTAKSKLRAYPVKEDGTLGEGHDFGSVPGPDGVKVDLDGKVYAAGRTGIGVWDASGKFRGTLKVPVTPNGLAFGGADRRTMYITTPPSVYKIGLDQALKMLTTDESANAKDSPPPAPVEAMHKRIAAKVEQVQTGARKWAESGRDPSVIAKAMEEKFKPLMEAGKVVEAEAELDRVLEQLTKGSSAQPAAKDIPKEASSYAERLPPKIQKIQKELPTWIEMPGNKEKAAAFMQKLKEHLDAKNFEEAEKTADSILKMMGLSAPAAAQSGQNKPPQTQPSSPPSIDPTKRLTEKVERVKAGAQKWAASGRDPSTIVEAMQEKFKPLMEAGKVVEAEAELDRILEQLGDKKAEGAAADAPAIPQDASSYEERLPPKIHRIQKELPVWSEKPGNKEKAAAFMQKLKEHLDAMNFAEADKTADAILAAMGVSAPAAGQSGENKPQPTPPSNPPSNDTTKRLTEKVERVKAGAQKWAASGRDPATIAKAMQEKFKPLMEAGKVAEAEAELDRVLKALGQEPDAKPESAKEAPPKSQPASPRDRPPQSQVDAQGARWSHCTRRCGRLPRFCEAAASASDFHHAPRRDEYGQAHPRQRVQFSPELHARVVS